MLCGGKLKVASVLLTWASFLCISHPFPFPWPPQSCQPLVSPAGICVWWAGRVWGQQAAALCTRLLVAWALEIRSLLVEAWGSWKNFLLGSKCGLRNLPVSSCFENISLGWNSRNDSLSFAPVHEQLWPQRDALNIWIVPLKSQALKERC